ncbi:MULTISPECIES: hypothetical protein [unclassified Rhodococcus (in: high G+C Gram-positive bacteria)]|nr:MULTISPECIES: hypothetical protein [unclassified Rhodococcus (in: high G+C Gram-positive bacteria)]
MTNAETAATFPAMTAEKIAGRTYYTVTRANGDIEFHTGGEDIARLFHGR